MQGLLSVCINKRNAFRETSARRPQRGQNAHTLPRTHTTPTLLAASVCSPGSYLCIAVGSAKCLQCENWRGNLHAAFRCQHFDSRDPTRVTKFCERHHLDGARSAVCVWRVRGSRLLSGQEWCGVCVGTVCEIFGGGIVVDSFPRVVGGVVRRCRVLCVGLEG